MNSEENDLEQQNDESDDRVSQSEKTSPEKPYIIHIDDIKRELEDEYAEYGLSSEVVDEIDEAREAGRSPNATRGDIEAYDQLEEARKERLQKTIENLTASAAIKRFNESLQKTLASAVPKIDLGFLRDLSQQQLDVHSPNLNGLRNQTIASSELDKRDETLPSVEVSQVDVDADPTGPRTQADRENDRLEEAATMKMVNILQMQLDHQKEQADAENTARFADAQHRKREGFRSWTSLILVLLTLAAAIGVPFWVLSIQNGG